MEKLQDPENSRFLYDVGFSPRRTAARISLGYAFLGWLWILTSDSIVPLLTKDVETMVLINGLKGSMFIFVTALVLFLLLHFYLKQIWQIQTKNILSAQELENTCEELTASEIELRCQYEKLTSQTDLLLEKDQELWALFENMHDAFSFHEIICDTAGIPMDYKILNVNPAYEKLLGRTRQELVGKSMSDIIPVIDVEWIQVCGKVALTGHTMKIKSYSRQLGRHLDISLHSPKPGFFAMLARDITEETEHENVVERLAYYDSLTGLPNRVRLIKILRDEIESAGAAGALLYIDIDDLKMVNDSYGHSYGDALIFTAAMHLVSMGNERATVARIGGDEFVMLLPGMTEAEKVEQTAQELVELLSREYEVHEVRVHASASLGIALYPADGSTSGDILKNADTALHEAKRGGKRCWRFFKPAMQEVAYENMVLSSGLRNAMSNGELTLHFQPQILLADYRVVAFEALLRWHSPIHGSVSPARFIPLAENSHLIETIGAWVMREACGFAARLAGMGYADLRVAVNVSPKQLIATDFIAIVKMTLAETGIEPGQLEIEITENVLIESMEDSIAKLKELAAMGVRLALDDFGAGYSSLTYLRQLPVDTVKIDKSFIDKITTDASHSALIAAIINMSHGLGLNVVAEGVETPEQMANLTRYHCDMIQGYVISKAVPEAEAMAILQKSKLPDKPGLPNYDIIK